MQGFYGWVRNIILFLLLISLIYQMLPDSEYRKYMKVCAGLILTIITVWPLVELSGTQPELSYFLGLENLKIGTENFILQTAKTENEKVRYMTETYKTEIEKQILQLFNTSTLYPIEAVAEIEDDHASEDYGKIYSIYVSTVTNQEDIKRVVNSEKSGIEPVENIEIENITMDGGSKTKNISAEEQVADTQMQEEAERIAEILSEYFCVDRAAITISVK